MRVSFLVTDAFELDDTVRSVLALADALSRLPGLEVEVVSVLRPRETPALRPGRLIHLGFLVDSKSPAVRHSVQLAGASRLVPGQDRSFRRYSPISDAALERYARRWRPNVFVVTSPGLAIAMGRCAPDSPIVLWSHDIADSLPVELDEELTRWARSCGAVAAVTEHEAATWRTRLGSTVPTAHIPPAVPTAAARSADVGGTTVVSVGPLEPDSGFPDVITAFAEATSDRPAWDLLILGEGSQRNALAQQAEGLGVDGRVTTAASTAHQREALADSALAVSARSFDPSGGTLLEAMGAGLALISSDCPVAPAELVRHEQNGLLYPSGDARSLAHALDRVLSDGELRAHLAEKARLSALALSPDRLAGRFLELLAETGVEEHTITGMSRKARRAVRAAT